MRKFTIIIFGALLLLAFAQCAKDKEKEQNIQLTDDAIEIINDNIQSQLDLLSDKSIPEVAETLATWLASQEGVSSALARNNNVEIVFVDGTKGNVIIYDQTIEQTIDMSIIDDLIHNVLPVKSSGEVIGHQNAFIFDPFHDFDDFNPDALERTKINEGDDVENILLYSGVQVKHLMDKKCTVESLYEMTEYGYIQFITHGSPTGITTREYYRGNKNKYREEREQGLITVDWITYKRISRYELKERFFGVTDKFFEAFDNRFNNALVFNSACNGFDEDDASLRNAFMRKGVKKYFGFNNASWTTASYFYSVPFSYWFTNMLFSADDIYTHLIGIKPDMTGLDAAGVEHTTKLKCTEESDMYWSNIPSISTNGLVAYYPFNGNANDESGHGNDGILSGNNIPALTTDRHNCANSAYEFGGYYNPNWIKVPNSESLVFGHEMTISFWMQLCEIAGMDGWGNYSTTGPGFATVCKAGDGNACFPGLYIMTGPGQDGNGLNIGTNNSNGNAHNHDLWNFDISATVPNYDLCQWINITLVVSDDIKTLFVDGKLMAEDKLHNQTDFTYMNQQDLYIGVMAGRNPNFGWGGGFWYPFYGKIDDVRIYNRALNPLEVKALYSE